MLVLGRLGVLTHLEGWWRWGFEVAEEVSAAMIAGVEWDRKLGHGHSLG